MTWQQLGLRTDEDLGRVLAGERLEVVRRDILDRCAAAYRGLFPGASAAQVAWFLRCVWAGRGPRGRVASPLHGPRTQRPWPTEQAHAGPSGTALAKQDAERARAGPTGTHPPRAPARHLHQARPLPGHPSRHPPAVQEALITELAAIRARCAPPHHHPGLRAAAAGRHARRRRPQPLAAKPPPAHGPDPGQRARRRRGPAAAPPAAHHLPGVSRAGRPPDGPRAGRGLRPGRAAVLHQAAVDLPGPGRDRLPGPGPPPAHPPGSCCPAPARCWAWAACSPTGA